MPAGQRVIAAESWERQPALNSLKVKAIYSASMKYYPILGLETTAMADREMRIAIDEICHESRAAETEKVAC